MEKGVSTYWLALEDKNCEADNLGSISGTISKFSFDDKYEPCLGGNVKTFGPELTCFSRHLYLYFDSRAVREEDAQKFENQSYQLWVARYTGYMKLLMFRGFG